MFRPHISLALLVFANSSFAASVIPSSKLPPSRMLVPNELHGLGTVSFATTSGMVRAKIYITP